jgi:uncharacterized protein YkwD
MKKIAIMVITLIVILLFPATAQAKVSQSDQLINLINLYRYQNGMELLSKNYELESYACKYTKEMSENNFFSHESPFSGDTKRRISKNLTPGWTVAGENLGRNCDEPFTLIKNFKLSESHNANLLCGDYTSVGVGVYEKGGIKCWAVEFARY